MSSSVSRSFLLGLAAAVATASGAAAQYYGPPPGAYPYNPPPAYPGPPPVGNRFYGYARPLPRDVVVERLEDQGYEDVADPRLAGSTYVTVATMRGRERVRLVVDAFRGVVVQRDPISRRDARLFEDDGVFPSPSPYERSRPVYPGETYRAPPPEAEPRLGAPAGRAPERARPSTEARLPPPADARLAPAPGAAVQTPAPVEPTAPAPALPRSRANGSVDGVNPDAGSRPAPSAAKPTRPATPASREARKPDVGFLPAKPSEAAQGAPAASPGPQRPVRVIQGVTPLNNNEAAMPAPQASTASPPPTPAPN